MKKCKKCGIDKDFYDFYKCIDTKDGLRNICKKCHADNRKTRDLTHQEKDPNFIAIRREKSRERYYLYHKGKKVCSEIKKKSSENYKTKFPEKWRAKNLSSHIKASIKGYHIHHWSYREEDAKDIIELPSSDHYLLHRNIIYDQKFFRYRTYQGVLLESKQSHINLLKHLKNE